VAVSTWDEQAESYDEVDLRLTGVGTSNGDTDVMQSIDKEQGMRVGYHVKSERAR